MQDERADMDRCAATFAELFAHSDWARDKLLDAAAGLGAEELDRAFEMGAGSLRATFQHLYGAERVWLERWRGAPQAQFPPGRDVGELPELRRAWGTLAAARNEDIAAGVSGSALRRAIHYTDRAGCARRLAFGDILLHVCNHGAHHRAQTLNMLRQLGGRPLGDDYLYYCVEHPTTPQPPGTMQQLREYGFGPAAAVRPGVTCDLPTLRKYLAYGDWAQRAVLEVAAGLSGAKLDQVFEMGLGTLRRTLMHVRDAEQWWYDNWTRATPAVFAKLPETTSLRELKKLMVQTAARRDEFLDELGEDGLLRVVAGLVRPGLRLEYRVGESLMQLCLHGTHHRAQAVNMLRRLGAQPPELDYAAMAQ